METIQVNCSNCAGFGHIDKYVYDPEKSTEPGVYTAHRKTIVCERCKGKGYIERVMFSVEEAKAILKHCGLDTES